MSLLDIIIAVIVVISLIVGLVRGFLKEVLSIIGWIASIWLAFTFGSNAGDFIHQYVQLPAEAFRTSAGFIAVFILSLFAFSIINWLIVKILTKAPIKGIDRFLGMIFGVVRAVAIVALVIVIGRGFNMDESDWWQRSASVAYFNPAADFLESLLPDSLRSDTESPLSEPEKSATNSAGSGNVQNQSSVSDSNLETVLDKTSDSASSSENSAQ